LYAEPQDPVVEWNLPANVEYISRWLVEDAPVSVQGDAGDFTMLKVAAFCKDHALDELTTFELVQRLYNPRCKPPWKVQPCDPKDDLTIKVANAFTYLHMRRPGQSTPEYEFGEDDPEMPNSAELYLATKD